MMDIRWSQHAISMESDRLGEKVRCPEHLLRKVAIGMPDGAVSRVAYQGNVFVMSIDGDDIKVLTIYKDERVEDASGVKQARRQDCQRGVRWERNSMGESVRNEQRKRTRHGVRRVRTLRASETCYGTYMA